MNLVYLTLPNPTRKLILQELEELFLKYKLSKSSITFGKMLLNTPFFNPQDWRMRPTFEEGAWLNIAENKKFGFNGGLIWSVSPRSTVKWYRLQESMGLYPTGVNDIGKKSDYFGNVITNGMAIANVYFKPADKFKINLCNGYLDNVMNIGIIEINAKQNLSEKTNLYQRLIFVQQDALSYGGNIDQSKSYFKKGGMSNVINAQFGVKGKINNRSINYTHTYWRWRVFNASRTRERNFLYVYAPRA